MTPASPMRIVFVGAVDFSRHCLEATVEAGGHVVAALAPFAEQARGNADYSDLGSVAHRHGIPFRHFKRISDPEVVAHIRQLAPDVVFVFGLSQLLTADLLAIPRLGVIGSHPTLLPEGRGRHPLIWALVKGLKRSGLSFFYMDTGADTGDILWQRPFPINPDDTAADLYEHIKSLASEAIPEMLTQLASGSAPRIAQDATRASVWPKRTEKDGEIEWAKPARQIHNLVRALAKPYVGAHTFVGSDKVVVWRSRMLDGSCGGQAASALPGTILECRSDALRVRAGDGLIELADWQPRRHEALREGALLGR